MYLEDIGPLYVIRLVGGEGGKTYLKAASGTYATPKLYKKSNVFSVVGKLNKREYTNSRWEAVPVTMIFGSPETAPVKKTKNDKSDSL